MLAVMNRQNKILEKNCTRKEEEEIMIKLAEELGNQGNSGQLAIMERPCAVVELGELDSTTGLTTFQICVLTPCALLYYP